MSQPTTEPGLTKRGGAFPKGRRRQPKGLTLSERLLESRQRGVDRELGDERRAAPVRARATRIDRGRGHARRGVVAGEGVAVTLVEVGVVVAQVEREHLVG